VPYNCPLVVLYSSLEYVTFILVVCVVCSKDKKG